MATKNYCGLSWRISVRWAEAAFAPPAKGLLKRTCQPPFIFAWRRVLFIGSVGVASVEGAIGLRWFWSRSLSLVDVVPNFASAFAPFAAKKSLMPFLSTCAMYTWRLFCHWRCLQPIFCPRNCHQTLTPLLPPKWDCENSSSILSMQSCHPLCHKNTAAPIFAITFCHQTCHQLFIATQTATHIAVSNCHRHRTCHQTCHHKPPQTSGIR